MPVSAPERMTRPIRVAYLQKAPSGHANACLRALRDTGADLLATLPPPLDDSPHDEALSSWLPRIVPMDGWSDPAPLLAELESFRPDVLLVVSWDKKVYRICSRAFRGRAVRVLCMDNQWLRTPKQLLGVASSRFYLRPCFDKVFLPGDRQRHFARRLGFDDDAIHSGFYSADVDLYSGCSALGPQRSFAYIGRLVEEKGVEVLTDAYRQYRTLVDDPWSLIVGGSGPLARQFDDLEGVDQRGFLNPVEVCNVLESSSALVLPSRFEPWGVVIHEATSAGRLVITTDRAGAADDLVEHLRNGFIAEAGSTRSLLAGLLWCHRLDESSRLVGGELSRRLADAFSPERWANAVLSMAAAKVT